MNHTTKGLLQNIPDIVNAQSLSLCSQSINSILASFPESNHDPLKKNAINNNELNTNFDPRQENYQAKCRKNKTNNQLLTPLHTPFSHAL